VNSPRSWECFSNLNYLTPSKSNQGGLILINFSFLKACLKLLKSGDGEMKAGCLTPIPEYPLYNASLGEFDIAQVN